MQIRPLVAADLSACTFLRENDEAGLRGYLAAGHVFHLFVDKRRHGQGLARRLWQTARAAAVERVAPTQCVNGLYFNPMRYVPA